MIDRFVLRAAVAIVVAGCTGQQRQDAKTALAIASETCDVLVILEDDAKEVCVPIEQVEELARNVLRAETKITIPQPENAQRLTVKRARLETKPKQ